MNNPKRCAKYPSLPRFCTHPQTRSDPSTPPSFAEGRRARPDGPRFRIGPAARFGARTSHPTQTPALHTIDRATWILLTVAAVLLVALWALFNRPDYVPAWPAKVQGVSFSPFRADQSPETQVFPTEEEIARDLDLLSDSVRSVRTYSTEGSLGAVPRLAREEGLKTTVGVWISDDLDRNEREIRWLAELLPEARGAIKAVIVGNETLLRGEVTAEELAGWIDQVRRIVAPIPVTMADTWDNWHKNPEIVEHVDFITAHVLPYWEGVPAGRAPDYVFERYDELRQMFRGKRVMLGEVGWPSEGRQRGGAIPSPKNQAKFLREFLAEATARGTDYFVLEAFDQIWKTHEGAVGRYWGVYDASRQPKFPFTSPVRAVPEWPALAGFSIAFTILLLTLLLRDSAGLVHGGRGFLVFVSLAISTVVVWLVYDYSRKYLSWEQVVVGIGLLGAAFCVVLVVLAEAHEWAESLWNRRIRAPAPPVRDPDAPAPKVSVHVPIHNEPPGLVIETLEALAALDYPDYEVVVVDNNTSDPAVWRPVQQWCEARADEGAPVRFRFFHVDPLDGFKAGALNYALERTAPDAELVAVIDSDYTVEPDWLGRCTTLFDDEGIAIVQAPQDYRDAHESRFKSMIYCEYAGFFGIGMVNRDARNAIIQHGTMTIVRRQVLDDVHGWSEWCITEDAELGLRVLAEGHRAAYVPRSYGRGVMPDNFLDYKKQRFRWAYGSVLILRHHARYFLSLSKSALTPAQRYHFVAGWLPWMADGLSLAFNLVALAFSVALILFPHLITPPEVILSLLPISFFAFKVTKMFVLYRWRMNATLRQSLAAGIAGLAVSHTIARAMFEGLRTRSVGFFRTPKRASAHGTLRALQDAREELLIGGALLLAALVIGQRDDAYLLDTKLWMVLLVIQSVPYVAAVTLSLIGASRDPAPASLASRAPGASPSLLGRLPDALERTSRR